MRDHGISQMKNSSTPPHGLPVCTVEVSHNHHQVAGPFNSSILDGTIINTDLREEAPPTAKVFSEHTQHIYNRECGHGNHSVSFGAL